MDNYFSLDNFFSQDNFLSLDNVFSHPRVTSEKNLLKVSPPPESHQSGQRTFTHWLTHSLTDCDWPSSFLERLVPLKMEGNLPQKVLERFVAVWTRQMQLRSLLMGMMMQLMWTMPLLKISKILTASDLSACYSIRYYDSSIILFWVTKQTLSRSCILFHTGLRSNWHTAVVRPLILFRRSTNILIPVASC